MHRGWLPGLVIAAGCGRFGFGGSPGGDAPADEIDDAADAPLDDVVDVDAFTAVSVAERRAIRKKRC